VRPDGDETLNLPFQAKKFSIDEQAEIKMLGLLNEERIRRGLESLTLDEGLRKVARLHSEDMWVGSYFSHTNLDNESPFDRLRQGGVNFNSAGENLAMARTVERAHYGLMNSPGHRANILDPSFSRVGIGVVSAGIYGKMFTQNFAD
jgi:uncharacterized protein YkwD